MILALLKRAVKAALTSATEEWLIETGVPKEAIDEARVRREEHAAAVVARADVLAARRLGVDDERDACSEVPALPMPSAERMIHADEGDLMAWVHRQRHAGVAWAEVAQAASEKGCECGEDALRSRYKRWRDKHAEANSASSVA